MDVVSAWNTSMQWCTDNAGETAAAALPPAPGSDVRRAEDASGYSWPQDLRDWYAIADGAARTPAGYFLPNYRPLPISEVVTHAEMWRQITSDLLAEIRSRPVDPLVARFGAGQDDPYDLERLSSMTAGTPAGVFLPAFVPIAEDQSGSDLFIDLRSGDLRGCVSAFTKGEADSAGPLWPSLAAMLTDVATALTTDRTIGHWQPEVAHGRLQWVVNFD